MQICGIDYGSKLAGTTVLCAMEAEEKIVRIQTTRKKQDADQFLKKELRETKPDLVFLDAPLSLPKVYSLPLDEKVPEGADFFYRKGDRQLRAMSPMFLGGLTARAMRLKAEMFPIPFFETYPAVQAQRLGLEKWNYKKKKKDIDPCWEAIAQQVADWQLLRMPENWHEIDALLALVAAERYVTQQQAIYGDQAEGLIYI